MSGSLPNIDLLTLLAAVLGIRPAAPSPAVLAGATAVQPAQPQPQYDPAVGYTNQYNTQLTPEQEQAFQQWVAQQSAAQGRDVSKDLYDYDLRGAWLANAEAASNGHLPDTWKKPNEPTFSTQSKYNTPDMTGGAWTQDQGGGWVFTPSPFNLQMNPPETLQKLWPEQQPGARLNLPTQGAPK